MKKRFKDIIRLLFHENVTQGKAAAAVFLGVFVGVFPIWGLQSIVAIALASLFRLNRLLTFAATFINNFISQPFLVIFSIQTGHFLMEGRFLELSINSISQVDLRGFFRYWILGSIILGIILSATFAFLTYMAMSIHSRRKKFNRKKFKEIRQFIIDLYKNAPLYDRNFVKWKIRLDKLFLLLSNETFEGNPVIDLGCGYGLGLAMAASNGNNHVMLGCDTDPHRIKIAREVFKKYDSKLVVEDVRKFTLQKAGLILIFDVLQFLNKQQQEELIARCCDSLLPGGKLIFRINNKTGKLFSWITYKFDQIIFLLSNQSTPPQFLHAEFYLELLCKKGFVVRQEYFRNKLPLSHVLFIAQKLSIPTAAFKPSLEWTAQVG